MALSAFCDRHPNVFLYIPNLIGYARVGATLYAFSVAQSSPVTCVTAYFLGFVCDELDGRAARAFNQTSTLGAVLDMVTDRVATSCLLCVLCMRVPSWFFLFLLMLGLDIFSHWFQMYASLLSGAATHKERRDVKSRSALVRLYYRSRVFMGFCCISVEVLLLCVYMASFTQFQTPSVLEVQIPQGLGKSLAASMLWTSQAVQAASPGLSTSLAELARALPGWHARLPPVVLLGALALPGAAVKQLCNWVQLRTAARSLVDSERSRAPGKAA